MKKFSHSREIPDLWHIAMRTKSVRDRDAILEAWYYAHSYQEQLQATRRALGALLEIFPEHGLDWTERERAIIKLARDAEKDGTDQIHDNLTKKDGAK